MRPSAVLLITPVLLLSGCATAACDLLGDYLGSFMGDLQGDVEMQVARAVGDDAAEDLIDATLTLTGDVEATGIGPFDCSTGSLVIDLTDPAGDLVGSADGILDIEGTASGSWELSTGESGTWSIP